MARTSLCPYASSLSFLAEEFPDGFPDDCPAWSSFCPDRGVKRTLAEHEGCTYFAGLRTDERGNAVAFRCALRRG